MHFTTNLQVSKLPFQFLILLQTAWPDIRFNLSFLKHLYKYLFFISLVSCLHCQMKTGAKIHFSWLFQETFSVSFTWPTLELFQVQFSRKCLLFWQNYFTRSNGSKVQLKDGDLRRGSSWASPALFSPGSLKGVRGINSAWPSQQAPFRPQTHKLTTDSVGYRPSR